MAEKKKYNSILISGRKDETLTYSKFVKDEESGESVKESLDKKVNITDELTTKQIKDGAITNEKMAAGSVGNTNLQDGSVSNEKLEDGSITNEKLAENSITKDKLKDNTIGVEKLDPELRQTINAATGLPENLVETIQNVDDTLKDHQNQLNDKQSQIDDKQQQITANDEDISLLQTRSTQMEETIKGIAATGGASVASAVTYDNTTSQLTSVNIQGAVDELQADKVDKTSILQESGEADDKVMSQKAVSDKLSDLPSDGALNMLKDAVWENKNIGGSTQLIRLITRDYIPVIAGNEYFIKSNDGYKFRVYTFDKNYNWTESDLYDELSLQIPDDVICIRIMGQKTNDSEYINIDESKNFFMSLKNPSSNIYDLQDKAINDKQTLSFIDYFNGKTWINEGIGENSTPIRAKVDALIKVSPLKKYHVFCPDGLAYNIYTYKSTKGDRTESELYSSSSDFTFGEEIAYIRFVARKQDDKTISLDEAAKFKFVEVLEEENVSKTTDLSKRGLHATRNNVAEISGNVVNDNVSWENKNLADAYNLTRITSDYIKIEKDTRYTLQYDSTIINVSPALYEEEGGSRNEFEYGVSSFYSGNCGYLRLLIKNAISGDLTVTVENVIDGNIRVTPYINKFFPLLDSELNKEYNAFENKYIDNDGNVHNGNDYVMSKKIYTKAKTITWNYSKDAIPFTGSNYGRICAFDAVTNEKLEFWGCQTATRTIDLSSYDWFTATNGFYLVASFFKGYADAKLVMENETYYPIYPSNLVHSIAHLGLSEIPFHLQIGSYNVATYWHDTKQSDDSYTTKKFTDELKGYLNGFLTGDILFVQEDYTSIKINSEEENAVDVYETFYKPFFPYASRGHNYWCSIYSKYPLLNARTLKVSDAETSYTPREYALAEISIGGKLIGIASIHGGIKSKEGRQNEFKTLINEMAKYDYVIIAGDTNIGIGELNNPSAALEELSIFIENGYTLANGIGFWGENVTGIEDSNNYKGIDNIMVRAFNINSFKIEDSFLDHKPIASDISIIV